MTVALRRSAILGAMLAAGCAAEAAPSGPFTARDSAGVRIVEYADLPVASRTLSLSAAPRLRVGDSPGERRFDFVGSAALLPDGSAIVLDGRDQQELVWIDPTGSARRLVARGQGPDEVRSVAGLVSLGGDSVLIQDIGNGRMTIFVRDSLAGSVNVFGADVARSAVVVGYAGRGHVLMRTSSLRRVAGKEWLPGHLFRFDLASSALDSVGSFDMVGGLRDDPYGPDGMVASGGRSFVVGRSDLARVTWIDENGATRQTLRWKPDLRYPTEADVDAMRDGLARDVSRAFPGRPDLADAMAAANRDAVDLSEPMPLFASMRGDGRGGVWLADFPRAGIRADIARWHHIAETGEWLGTLDLPEGFRVLDLNGDRVLGTMTDSLDVQSVAVFDLTESPLAR